MADPVVVTPPVPGSPEHQAAMVAKFDSAQTANIVKEVAPVETLKPAAVKPEGVPDKFWNAKEGVVNFVAWNASTVEAARKITELSTTKPAAPVGPTAEATAAHATEKVALMQKVIDLKAATTPDPAAIAAAEAALAAHPAAPVVKPAEAAKALDDVGLNMDDFNTEFAEKGELSPESYAKLEKAGIPKTTVDLYIAGRQALSDAQFAKAYALTGGEENFNAMKAWAAASLTPAELQGFNASVSDKVSVEQQHLAIQGLYQRYVAENGKTPNLLGGTNSGASNGFRSPTEMTTAMKDPRYAKDPAYRADVAARLAVTTAF